MPPPCQDVQAGGQIVFIFSRAFEEVAELLSRGMRDRGFHAFALPVEMETKYLSAGAVPAGAEVGLVVCVMSDTICQSYVVADLLDFYARSAPIYVLLANTLTTPQGIPFQLIDLRPAFRHGVFDRAVAAGVLAAVLEDSNSADAARPRDGCCSDPASPYLGSLPETNCAATAFSKNPI
jgi:hypothetical protein